jgi:hypothetical protein
MNKEIMDLFSDSPDLVFNGAEGGKPDLRQFLESLKNLSRNPEFLHQSMQLSGIVGVNPDGITAEGRCDGFGAVALPAGKGAERSLPMESIPVSMLKKTASGRLRN